MSRSWSLITVVTLVLLGVLWLLPYTSARAWPVFAFVVSLDKPVAVTMLALAGSILLAALVRRDPSLALAGGAAAIIAMLFCARLVAQGVGDGHAFGSDEVSIRFISWNAGDLDPAGVGERLGPVLAADDVRVLVLPETGWFSADLVGEALREQGLQYEVFRWDSSATSVLIRADLAEAGQYRLSIDDVPPWAGLAVSPRRASAETPVVIATHLQQPSLGNTATWREHLEWVSRACDKTPIVVVIGDLNTTLNNLSEGGLGGCRDVAAEHSAGAASTWHRAAPLFLGVAIDRFLVGQAYDVKDAGFRVRRDIDASGSDHWVIEGSIP